MSEFLFSSLRSEAVLESTLDFCPNKRAFGLTSYSPYFQSQCIINRVFSLPGALTVNKIQKLSHMRNELELDQL